MLTDPMKVKEQLGSKNPLIRKSNNFWDIIQADSSGTRKIFAVQEGICLADAGRWSERGEAGKRQQVRMARRPGAA